MTSLTKALYLLLYFLVLTPKSNGALKSSFGESCSKDHRCDSRAMLTCSNKGICECLMTSSMIFDSTSKKCVTLAGEKCSYTVSESERSWSELLPCISNSECVDGICSCESGFFEHSNGTCEAQQSQGQVCSTDNMCTNNLICDQLTLACDCNSYQIYDKDKGACLNKAGHNCSTETNNWCVKNAVCRRSDDQSERCFCNEQSFQDEDSCELKRDIGKSCTPGSDVVMCDTAKGLHCGDTGVCKCGSGQGYHIQARRCVTAPGEYCGSDSYDWRDCVENSVCQYNCDNGCRHRCKCTDSFFHAPNTGTCEFKRGFGQECSADDNCNSNLKLVCGKNGTCKCEDGRAFDTTSGMCWVGPGMRCRTGDRDLECVPNANCYSDHSYYGYNYDGECRCQDQYFSTPYYTCERKRGHGKNCVTNAYCADITDSGDSSFLQCREEKCVCDANSAVAETNPTSSTTNNPLFPCLRKSGVSCNPHNSKQRCVVGAECNWNSSRCECLENDFWQTPENLCRPKKELGETCEVAQDCKQNLRLSCSDSGKCVCNQESTLHPVHNVCVAKAGENCDEEVLRPVCVPNAMCLKGECICKKNVSSSDSTLGDGLCYMEEGQVCDSDEFRRDLAGGNPVWQTCLRGLRCQNSTCSCLHKDHQIYDKKAMKCLTLVRGPCDQSEECVSNAECFEKNGRKRCRCTEGFTPRDRVCDLAYGSNCTQGLYPTSRCDRLAPLGCSVRGICECSDLQVYDNETNKCRGLLGAKCVIGKTDFCTRGSHCVGFRSGKGDTGTCECQSENGFIEQNNGCTLTAQVKTMEPPKLESFAQINALDSDGNLQTKN